VSDERRVSDEVNGVMVSVGGLAIDTVAAVAVVVVFVVALNVGTWWLSWRRGPWLRWPARVAAAALVLVPVGAGFNAYYAYFPTLDALLGRRATLAMSHADILRLRARLAGSPATERVGEASSVRPAPPAAIPETTASGANAAAAVRGATTSTAPHGLDRPDTTVSRGTTLHGGVDEVAIPGVVSGFRARSAQVYLPPAWFRPNRPALPVIMLLHGSPGEPADWTRGGMADVAADRWANEHGGIAPIIVMPDPNGARFADSGCVDGRQRRAETYLTVDVREFVIASYGASSDRSSWAVGGLSEGGTCAVHLAIRHPDRFSLFLAYGADARLSTDTAERLFAGSPAAIRAAPANYSPVKLLRRRPPQVAGTFCAGTGESGDASAAREMYGTAQSAGIDARLVLLPGGHHTFRVWRDCFARSLPWAATRLQLGKPAPSRRAPSSKVTQ
jgi:S-formylglutathione hydrolase FrmB